MVLQKQMDEWVGVTKTNSAPENVFDVCSYFGIFGNLFGSLASLSFFVCISQKGEIRLREERGAPVPLLAAALIRCEATQKLTCDS